MSTSGSFTPQIGSACPETVFTRAALIALRDGDGLNPGCHYFSVGPVIGTAGNTSPTIIEQHAVTQSMLSEDAKAATSFAASAWEASYDIDAGTAGTIHRLKDDWNNVAEDTGANAPTVHTRVPWHRGGTTFSGNRFNTAVLTGWDVAVGTITENDIQGSTVNLSGMTGASSAFSRNQVINGSSVSCLSGARFEFFNNTVTDASLINVDAATTARVTISENQFRDSYRVQVNAFTSAAVNGCVINGSRLASQGTAAHDMLCSGNGEIRFYANDVRQGDLHFNGSGISDVQQSTLHEAYLEQNVASSGSFTIARSRVLNANITIGAANVCPNVIDRSNINDCVWNWAGPISPTANNAIGRVNATGLTLTTAATATAGIALYGGRFNGGVITQNRTAGASSLHLTDCSMLGSYLSAACHVTDNGTVDPVQPIQLHGVELNESGITFGDMAPRDIIAALLRISMVGSVLNVSGLPSNGQIHNGRMLASTLTNAGFNLNVFTLDGMTKTLGGNQSSRAGSVAFDNYT